MRSLARITSPILLFLLLTTPPCFGQNVSEPVPDLLDSLDQIYGSDPTIINGQVYLLPNPASIGTPYFEDLGFVPGEVHIRGQRFDLPAVAYDIYAQKIVIRYRNKSGNQLHYSLSDAWFQSVSLGGERFEPAMLEDGNMLILRVIGTGKIRVGNYKEKELRFITSYVKPGYYYLMNKDENYLVIDGKALPFKGRREFLSLFSQDEKSALQIFIRQNKINLRKTDDKQLVELMKFCNSRSL